MTHAPTTMPEPVHITRPRLYAAQAVILALSPAHRDDLRRALLRFLPHTLEDPLSLVLATATRHPVQATFTLWLLNKHWSETVGQDREGDETQVHALILLTAATAEAVLSFEMGLLPRTFTPRLYRRAVRQYDGDLMPQVG